MSEKQRAGINRRSRTYLQRKRRRERDDRIEAAALLLAPGERCIALYRIFNNSPLQYYSRDEQLKAVRRLVGLAQAKVIASYDQPERLSAGHRYDERNRLAAAILACQAQNATLIIAVLGHLAASAAVLSQLFESGIRFVVCDKPNVNHRTIAAHAANAQNSMKKRMERLRSSWAAAKSEGRDMPTIPSKAHSLAVAANRQRATLFALQIVPAIDMQRRRGCSVKQIAENLNSCGIRTRRGRTWTRESLNRFLRSHANAVLPTLPQLAVFPAAEITAEQGVPVSSSGFPGRPSSRALVLTELRRRFAAGERHPNRLGGESATAWATVLADWLAATHPKAPQMKPNAGRLVLAPVLRELMEIPYELMEIPIRADGNPHRELM